VALGSRQDLDQRRASGPQDLASDGAAHREYENARRTLTAARVSVFSLDITNADTHALAQGMQTIAADTGGFYASSLDFPERPMRLVGGALNGTTCCSSSRPPNPPPAPSSSREREPARYVFSTSTTDRRTSKLRGEYVLINQPIRVSTRPSDRLSWPDVRE